MKHSHHFNNYIGQRFFGCMLLMFVFLLPFFAWAQPVGAQISNPIIMGTYGAGSYNYSDTKNNSTSNSFLNDNTAMQSDDIYYKFTIQAQAAVTISHCGSGFDTYMTLLNSSGGVITTNDDNGPACTGLTASISTTLAAGTYFIISEGYGANTGNITTSVNLVVQTPAAPPDTRNFIKIWDATSPQTDANTMIGADLVAVKQSAAYFDGLGRPEQTVVKKASLITDPLNPTSSANAKDLVSLSVYDAFGRAAQKYLPYVSPFTDGIYKANVRTEQSTFYTGATSPIAGQGETFFYSQTNFEASPLNRVQEQFAAGNSWVGTAAQTTESNRRSVKIKYYSNTTTDAVRAWTVTIGATGVFSTYTSVAYEAGQLYKTITIDEKGTQVVEFKDKEGKVVLKKVQLLATVSDDGTGSGHYNWLCTYYLYDNLGNLRCVIQPKGVEVISGGWSLDQNTLDELCFRYEYDGRNRMIMKKVPGAAVVNMVYDSRDRLVLTQDGKLAAQSQWMYTQYDDINRPIATGIWTTATTFGSHITAASAIPSATISNYPSIGTAGLDELTHTYYDDYTWLPGEGNPITSTRYIGDDAGFVPASNAPPYPQAMVQSTLTKGLVTGTKAKVLGTTQYLYGINFYDDKARVIQSINKDITGGAVIITNQYSFSGQVLASSQTSGNSLTNQATGVITRYIYDDLGRLLTVKKTVNTNFIGSVAEKTIVQNNYNALGMLSNKTLAPAYNGTGLEKMKYEYNIRGWLLGVNRNYLASPGQTYDGTHFGFELGYDKLTNSAGRGFNAAQWNGNINGMVWKSDGDDVKRKYDFTYDAANRLMSGGYEQDDATSSWNNSAMNYSMRMGNGVDPLTAYDANGNIKAMYEMGWKLGSPSAPVDDLEYSYIGNGNRLKYVFDHIYSAGTKLGDFQESAQNYTDNTSGNIADYAYDVNGNMLSDKNKNISNIAYNYLNLPAQITVDAKGSITYTYDAAGNKLKKVTVDNTVNPAKTTTTMYIGASVYENNVLQFIGHEEGRIRFDVVKGFSYDYFIKDHLGNVRMVLTEEQQTVPYIPASMETANATAENNIYSKLDEPIRVDKPSGYPTDNYTNPNNKVARVNGSGNKVGPGITLKVMAGDKFNIRVSSWWKSGLSNGNNSIAPTLLNDLISVMSAGIGGVAGTHGSVAQLQDGTILTPGINQFLNDKHPATTGTQPRAYVNWILFDEQFKIVSSNSGADPVGTDQVFKTHIKTDMPVDRNGYLYVYVSNETPNIDVFFDNLQVTHTRGPLLEENHYYPFGLAMAGVSSKALAFGGQENWRKFNNGTELNTDFDISFYETNFRSYDPQLGRFWQIDPLSDITPYNSPYLFANNNPISFNDPLGLMSDSLHPQELPEVVITVKKRETYLASYISASRIEYGDSWVGNGFKFVGNVGVSLYNGLVGTVDMVTHPINTLEDLTEAGDDIMGYITDLENSGDPLPIIGDDLASLASNPETWENIAAILVAAKAGKITNGIKDISELRLKPLRASGGKINGITISKGNGYGAKPRFDIHPLGNASKKSNSLPSWTKNKTTPHYHRGKGANLHRHRPWEKGWNDKSFWNRF